MRAILRDGNTAKDGTGTVVPVFESGEDELIEGVRFVSLGINVANTAVLFINNGQPNDNPENNMVCLEVTLPATTRPGGEAHGNLSFMLLAGHKLTATLLHPTAAGWEVAVERGTP